MTLPTFAVYAAIGFSVIDLALNIYAVTRCKRVPATAY